MAKKEETKKKGIRENPDGTRTNCTGRCTYTGSGACEQVTQFFKTYLKFVNKEIEFL